MSSQVALERGPPFWLSAWMIPKTRAARARFVANLKKKPKVLPLWYVDILDHVKLAKCKMDINQDAIFIQNPKKPEDERPFIVVFFDPPNTKRRHAFIQQFTTIPVSDNDSGIVFWDNLRLPESSPLQALDVTVIAEEGYAYYAAYDDGELMVLLKLLLDIIGEAPSKEYIVPQTPIEGWD